MAFEIVHEDIGKRIVGNIEKVAAVFLVVLPKPPGTVAIKDYLLFVGVRFRKHKGAWRLPAEEIAGYGRAPIFPHRPPRPVSGMIAIGARSKNQIRRLGVYMPKILLPVGELANAEKTLGEIDRPHQRSVAGYAQAIPVVYVVHSRNAKAIHSRNDHGLAGSAKFKALPRQSVRFHPKRARMARLPERDHVPKALSLRVVGFHNRRTHTRGFEESLRKKRRRPPNGVAAEFLERHSAWPAHLRLVRKFAHYRKICLAVLDQFKRRMLGALQYLDFWQRSVFERRRNYISGMDGCRADRRGKEHRAYFHLLLPK